jgi:hypothetical protein
MKELAVNQAEKIKTEKPKFAIVHRKDGDADYASTLISELASEVSRLLVFNCTNSNFVLIFSL